MKYIKYFEKYKQDIQTILRFYSFDWDDNIMKMPTIIHMEKLIDGVWIKEDVSTAKFSKVRPDKNWRYNKESFIEFRDLGRRGNSAFLEDVKKGLSLKNYGPSWSKFIECLTKGSIFSIITARGHEPESIRKGVEYIIDTELSSEQKDEMAANLMGYLGQFSEHDPLNYKNFDELKKQYLDNCDFIGITSTSFTKKYPEFDVLNGSANPEEAKKKAMEDFIKKINNFGKQIPEAKIKIGFSDDDISNVEEIHKFFKNELSLKYIMQYNVYDTSDFNSNNGKRIKVTENLVKFKSYNSVSNEFMDGMENIPKDKVKDVIDTSIEIFGDDDDETEDYPNNGLDYNDELDINAGPSNIRKYSSHPYGFWNAPSAHQGNISTGYPRPPSGVNIR